MRRIAIVGCRPAENGSTGWDLWVRIAADVDAFVAALARRRDVVIVSGGARGVDTRAARARSLGIEVVEHMPDYATHGSEAPLVRNARLVADCDELHAWPAPWSSGTWHTVRLARAAGKPVTIHEVTP